MKRSRTGSMQLSIEAIIVLVIAIVLLGLGIGFIKNFFTEGGDTLLGKFTPLKEDCDVSASNPIIPKEFHVKKGEVTSQNICVYNNKDTSVLGGQFQVVNCIGPGLPPTGSPTAIKISSLGQDIERGESVGYKTNIETDATVKVGETYICNIQVKSVAPATGGSAGADIGPVQVTFQVG